MILDKKIKTNSGSIDFTFWISGWIKEKENIIKEIKEEIHPFTILSLRTNYINGLTGRETEVHILAVKMIIFEINGEKDVKVAYA
jgi:hypothetical protein